MDLTIQKLTYSKKGKDIGTRCYPHAHNCTKPEEEDTHSIRKKLQVYWKFQQNMISSKWKSKK